MRLYWPNVALLLAALAVCGACGWWVVMPFRGRLGFPLATAILAGLVVLTAGALALHVLLDFGVRKAGLAAVGVSLAGSLAAARCFTGGSRRHHRGFLLLATAVVAVVAVALLTPADAFYGAPGLLYAYGTDHLGYAMAADWMREKAAHPGWDALPTDWYSSFPQFLFVADPRFGSFMLVALVSAATGRPGAFAYDLTCALV